MFEKQARVCVTRKYNQVSLIINLRGPARKSVLVGKKDENAPEWQSFGTLNVFAVSIVDHKIVGRGGNW